jgi:predicted RNase H-like HicB family nuclease
MAPFGRGSEVEVEKNIREAIEFHIEGMIEDGDLVPVPTSLAIAVEVA